MSAGQVPQRFLTADLQMVNDSFAGLASNKNVSGLATSVTVSKPGIPSLNECSVRITNLGQDTVERISTTSHENYELAKNYITVRAKSSNTGYTEVFSGEIFEAFGEYPSADTSVYISAMTAIYDLVNAEEPFTFDGRISGASLIQQFSENIGYTFNDNGVEDLKLSYPVLNGSSIEKMIQVAESMNVQLIIDDKIVTITPWNKGVGDPVKVQAPPAGPLVRYPAYNPNGIRMTILFDPSISIGGLVDLTSIVPKASGEWKIAHLTHYLDAFGAGDNWFTDIMGVRSNGNAL